MKNKILGALLLIAFICPIESKGKSVTNAEQTQQQNATPQPITVNLISPPKTAQETADQQKKDERDSSIKTRELLLTAVIALAAIVQACVAIYQWKVYREQSGTMRDALEQARRSADAAMKGISAMERLERPFLMIELRNKSEIWVVNKGRVPAQIVWYNPTASLRILSPEEIENLPEVFNYGFLHDVDTVQIINVPWIAPGGEMMVAEYAWIALDSDNAYAYQSGTKYGIFLSTIKYRGMLTEATYESRWCFRWFGRDIGLKLAGPYRYNSYT